MTICQAKGEKNMTKEKFTLHIQHNNLNYTFHSNEINGKPTITIPLTDASTITIVMEKFSDQQRFIATWNTNFENYNLTEYECSKFSGTVELDLEYIKEYISSILDRYDNNLDVDAQPDAPIQKVSMITLSTQHIDGDTKELFNRQIVGENVSSLDGIKAYSKRPGSGWFISLEKEIDGETTFIADSSKLPECLKDCALFVLANDATWINFDSNAEPLPQLPVY